MGNNLGMDPGRVANATAVMGIQAATLSMIADEIGETGKASRWPGVFGLFPGNQIMTAGSIFLAENAAADVRAAAASAFDLLGRINAQIAEQEYASSSGEGYATGTMGSAQASILYNGAMADPDSLVGMSPENVDEWWGLLSQEQKDAFIAAHPLAAGNTNGIAFEDRAAANRLTAQDMLDSRQDLTADQRSYLEDVAASEITLISFDPGSDRIIEMVGELRPEAVTDANGNTLPATTDVVNYVPGTEANMDGFYSGTTREMAANLVANADPAGTTVAFVYKDGEFPTFGTDGVYHSSWAASVGSGYHDFNTALGFENTNKVPVTSIEHSFGSSVGGYAESQGTVFGTRIALGGIGMTDEWKPNAGTNYFSFTGPNDVIRLAREKGTESLNLGFPIPPTEQSGYTELDPDFESWRPSPSRPDILDAADLLGESIDQHTRVAGVENNQRTLDQILEIIDNS